MPEHKPPLMSTRNRLREFLVDDACALTCSGMLWKSEIAGDRSGEEWGIHPQPDVRYQMYLEYLGKLCELMQKKYNEEYVWGDRSLQEDAKQ